MLTLDLLETGVSYHPSATPISGTFSEINKEIGELKDALRLFVVKSQFPDDPAIKLLEAGKEGLTEHLINATLARLVETAQTLCTKVTNFIKMILKQLTEYYKRWRLDRLRERADNMMRAIEKVTPEEAKELMIGTTVSFTDYKLRSDFYASIVSYVGVYDPTKGSETILPELLDTINSLNHMTDDAKYPEYKTAKDVKIASIATTPKTNYLDSDWMNVDRVKVDQALVQGHRILDELSSSNTNLINGANKIGRSLGRASKVTQVDDAMQHLEILNGVCRVVYMCFLNYKETNKFFVVTLDGIERGLKKAKLL